MNLPNFSDSYDIEIKARPLWNKLLTGIGATVEEKYDDLNYQKVNKLGDLVAHFRWNVEFKTRSKSYYTYASHEILFETNGNIESNNRGSSFFELKADLYAYGFLVDGTLKSISILFVKPLQQWLPTIEDKWNVNHSNTGSYYHTRFFTIDRSLIPLYMFFPIPGYVFKTYEEELIPPKVTG